MEISEQELKDRDRRAYARGYQAGQKRLDRIARLELERRIERQFWRQAFVAVSPYFAETNCWTQGERKLTTVKDRVQLAADWANEGLKHLRRLP